jgi:hypothetical protein
VLELVLENVEMMLRIFRRRVHRGSLSFFFLQS